MAPRAIKITKTNFKTQVYRATKKIPPGKVATYQQIAQLAGNSKAARAVGVLMKKNPYAPAVPCHRVVGFDGNLIGYSGQGGISQKKKLLISEGIEFQKDRINFKKFQWQPQPATKTSKV